MALESVSYLDDLVITNPVAGDPRSEGDDHLRNIKIGVKASFPGMTGRAWRVQVKGAGYTIVAGDNMSVLQFSGAYTASYTAAATLGNGHLTIIHASGGAVTIDPDGAELVNGAATLVVPQGSVALVLCDGTGLVVSTQFSSITANRVPYATATNVLGSSANLTFDGTTLTTHTATVSTGLLTASGGLSATTGVFSSTVTLSGTAANIALGSNFLSGDGGDEGVSVDASGNVTCSGTLAVNGAASTTDDTTFACFNTVAMTVNAFGAATTLQIGSLSPVGVGFNATAQNYIRHSFGGSHTSGGGSTVEIGASFSGALTGAAGDTSYLTMVNVAPISITTQGNTDTIGVVASLRITEPIITVVAGDMITVAATTYIASAPTEGTTNAALYVASGATYLLGGLSVSGGALAVSGSNFQASQGLTAGRLGTYDASTLSAISTFNDDRSLELSVASSAGNRAGIGITGHGATLFKNTLRFYTQDTERLRVADGLILVNDTSNANMTVGLTIKESTGLANQYLALKHADVAHGFVSGGLLPLETDDTFAISPGSITAGGIIQQVVRKDDTGGTVFLLECAGGLAVTTDTTTTVGPMNCRHGEHDGANAWVDAPANANLASWQARRAGAWATCMILKADDGELHLGNTTLVALDDEDDVFLVRAMQYEASKGEGMVVEPWENEFGTPAWSYDALRRVGVLGERDEKGECLFRVQPRFAMNEGAIWQTHKRVRSLEGRFAQIEDKLLQLENRP